jgi:hypothetical protein
MIRLCKHIIRLIISIPNILILAGVQFDVSA